MAVKSTKKAAKKKAAPAKKAVKKATKKKAAPAKKAAKKTAKKATKKKAAPAKKKATKKATKKKAAPAKKAVKKVAKKKAAKVVAPKPVVVNVPEVAKAPLAAIAVASVQVTNPIGSVGLPSVQNAVPESIPEPKYPVVQEYESNWSRSELSAVRQPLQDDAEEILPEIAQAEESSRAFNFESSEGAADDQADAGGLDKF